jgi:hypothetical protein
MSLKDCIGKVVRKVFLEWFYMNDEPISIIRLHIQLDTVCFSVLCSEEDVCVKKQEKNPTKIIAEKFNYIPVEREIYWLHYHEILSVNYLIDDHKIKRGIVFIFNNHHNFVYYNRGYEIKDSGEFDVDVNIKSLPYSLVDICMSCPDIG